ncbi:MAG: hypothetical protein ACXVH3_32370 [Solirubrobacteraceae bacterium]
MPDWAQITPTPAPREVERARKLVVEVEQRLQRERGRLQEARAAVTTAEADDRIAMAAQIRSGAEPVPDEARIDVARASVAATTRRAEATELALADAQHALVDTIERVRTKWCDQVDADLVRHRESAVAALDQVESAIPDAHTRSATAMPHP